MKEFDPLLPMLTAHLGILNTSLLEIPPMNETIKLTKCRTWTRTSFYRKRCSHDRRPGKERCGSHGHPYECQIILPGDDVGQTEREFYISRDYILFRIKDLFERSGLEEEGHLILTELERKLPHED